MSKIKIEVNGESTRVPQGCTVEQLLLDRLKPNKPTADFKAIAVEVNGELLTTPQYPEKVLADADQIEVVTLVGGG